jgi:hypothetical protein
MSVKVFNAAADSPDAEELAVRDAFLASLRMG